MNFKFSLSFLLGLIVILSFGVFVSALDCAPGDITSTQYCDDAGAFHNLVNDGGSCLNGYECANSSCVESVCKGMFEDLSHEDSGLIQSLWCLISGTDCCTPGITPDDCSGTLLVRTCSTGGIWVNINNYVNEKCGYSSGGGDGGSNDNGGGSSPGCNPLWRCGNWSSTSSNGSLCGTRTCYKSNPRCKANILKPIESLDCGRGISPDSRCGDAFCNIDETQSSCPEDCGDPGLEQSLVPTCGDGSCDIGETNYECSDDCPPEKPNSRYWLIPIFIIVLGGIGVGAFFLIRYIQAKRAEGMMPDEDSKSSGEEKK